MKLTSVYSVNFNGIEQDKKKNLKLTFVSAREPYSSKIFTHFLENLKKKSEINQKVHHVKNIDYVKPVEGVQLNLNFHSFIVLLFQMKSNQERLGFLFGQNKENEIFLIGSWPFNHKDPYTQEELNNLFEGMNNNLDAYTEIDLIY